MLIYILSLYLDIQLLVDELVKKVNELQSQNIMLQALNRQQQMQIQNLSQSLGDLAASTEE